MSKVRIALIILSAALIFGASTGVALAQQPDSQPARTPEATAPSTSSSAAPSSPVAPNPDAKTPVVEKPAMITVPAGTHLPLILHNGISTRSAKPGDPVYMETIAPVVVGDHVVIPAGSYVSGQITEAKRPGRVKGRGEIGIRLNTLIFPNGYVVNLNAIPNSASTGGGETTDAEGKIKGDTAKASDAGTLIKATGAGAGIGAIAGGGKGAGIGAALGAAGGLLAVLLTRGPEAELPRGSTLDAELSRPLFLDASKVLLNSPGQGPALPGPPNREPVRSATPF